MTSGLLPRESRVLALLQERPGLSTSAVIKQAGQHYEKTYEALKALRRAGVIVAEESPGTSSRTTARHWRPAE